MEHKKREENEKVMVWVWEQKKYLIWLKLRSRVWVDGERICFSLKQQSAVHNEVEYKN